MNKIAQVPIGDKFLGQGHFLTQLTGIGSLVSTIISFAFAAAGIIFLFLLVAGGIGVIAGAGSDNPQQVESGKKAVTSAILGFIVVFVAYWVVRLIEVITGVKIL